MQVAVFQRQTGVQLAFRFEQSSSAVSQPPNKPVETRLFRVKQANFGKCKLHKEGVAPVKLHESRNC